MNTLKNIIPIPYEVVSESDELPINSLKGFWLDDAFSHLSSELERMSHTFSLNWKNTPENAIVFRQDDQLEQESWEMNITKDGVNIAAGSIAAANYALDAFTQMLMTAMRDVPINARLNCGRIFDKPRFTWRGLLLDSARHFQRPALIKQVIRMLARWRMNVLHWHLIDNQGFRVPSKVLSRMTSKGTLTDGQYTTEDISDIVAFANENGVRIVPEFDMPGHSAALLKAYPEYACEPDASGEEICLSNGKAMSAIKDFLLEMMELFPNSEYFHLGGDEAITEHWEKCPRCQAAMRSKGYNSARQLEHDFMTQMTNFLIDNGRRPIVWTIPNGECFRQEVMMHVWQDMRDPIHYAAHGNPMVFSLHYSLYLDYPRNFSETSEKWMFSLDDKGIYLCDPHCLWPEKVKEKLLGTECCLWTETVPEWRVMQKLIPRFPAYMECAWSRDENKDWYDFCRRKELLEASAYFDYIKE